MQSFLKPVLITSSESPALSPEAGGKALSLQKMAADGLPVPPTLYLPPDASKLFVRKAGLEAVIGSLVSGPTESLRWEEIWDSSLALRNRFLHHPVPSKVAEPLLAAVESHFGDRPLAVRSCAPDEDSGLSHAGMHESFLNVRGPEALLRAVRLVWASLWSDRALLYRREMGLDSRAFGMAVLIQPMLPGGSDDGLNDAADLRSGVFFTRSPMDDSQGVVESVFGPASEVVSDAVKTERVFISRSDGRVLGRESSGEVVVDGPLAARLYELGRRVESLFGEPQDMEWTADGGDIVILQSRPVTTLIRSGNEKGWNEQDKRPWYLSLSRTHAGLLDLRKRIEEEILPGMLRESEEMRAVNLSALDCPALKAEVERRGGRLAFWRDTYWTDLIPFAHAVRQFGMLYNDVVAPDDPFEFTALLTGQNLMALERNAILGRMSRLVAEDPELAADLKDGRLPESGEYAQLLDEFMEQFGDLSCGSSWCDEGPWGIVRLTLEDVPSLPVRSGLLRTAELEAAFFEAVADGQKNFAREVLDLARVSYRLRDDDNLYLGKIQARYDEALVAARNCGVELAEDTPEARKATPKGLGWGSKGGAEVFTTLRGWGASAGIARGRARVVSGPSDLFDFHKGEVLVCDALDPNMTFVVPLAAAIVERRGGMLVHGAIIAREYGIPCVTGIEAVTERISTGTPLTVDGFRGTVAFGDAPHLPGDRELARNVLGGELQPCSDRPMTGFYRSGSCETGPGDSGSHVVCARVTEAFLRYTLERGNDLMTPRPELGFPGLAPGDRWCLCAIRWEEARLAGAAPPVVLRATHAAALRYASLAHLEAYGEDGEDEKKN